MEGFEEQLIAKYNYELSNLLELSKLNPKEIDKIYEENELTQNKMSSLNEFEIEHSPKNSWLYNISSGAYYNVFENSTYTYKLKFSFKRGTTKISKDVEIYINPDGTIEYEELKQLEFIIGKRCASYKTTINNLYTLLYKLNYTGLIEVDLNSLKIAIEMQELNNKLIKNLGLSEVKHHHSKQYVLI